MFKALDPLLHSQLRLGIMSLLMQDDSADFVYLQQKTESTSGNLSVQLSKLESAGYLTITKSFKENKPVTTCSITESGINAFVSYVDALKSYMPK